MKRRLGVLIFVIGMVATACGGDGGGGGVASLEAADTVEGDSGDVAGEPVVAEVDQEEAMLNFAACMRDNGVDIDDPTVDADGNVRFGGFRGVTQDPESDRAALQAAMEVCQENLEGIALGRGGGDFDLTELQDTLVEYAACMRDNGYDMADPDLSNFGPGGGEPGQGGGGGPFGEIDFDDPDFISAQEVCQDILAGFRGPGEGGRQAQGNG